jgi:hypothetical protein
VQYDKGRPTLTALLDAAAFRQRFPADHMIGSISPGSATGFA